MSAVPPSPDPTDDDDGFAPARSSRLAGDVLLYLVLAGLTLGAWLFSRQGFFEAGDAVGYWVGVVGSVMMVLLFGYPLRKHLSFMRRWGKVKGWFKLHMLLGIAGPLLILLHSTFRVGSLNGAVALYSMLIVVLSGVVGRFIYVRVHRGLHGEKTTLRELQLRAGLDQSETRSGLHFAPAVEARLLAFEENALKAPPGWPTFARQIAVLPWQQWGVYRACAAQLREPLRHLAEHSGWGAGELAQREREARALVRRYLNNVVRVAQFTAYERLFALWHVAHVPFVYLLVITSIVHVVAVHAY